MAIVRMKLRYPELSKIIQEETNKQNLEFKSYPIKVGNLTIAKSMDLVVISSDIISKWNAGFSLNMSPEFLRDENRLEIKDLDIKFETKNIIFKGLLNIAKGMILSRIEKIAETPITQQIEFLKALVDKELNDTEVPYDLAINSDTKNIQIEKLIFNKDHLFLEANIDQIITFNFKEKKINV